jgi:hypothetical protein
VLRGARVPSIRDALRMVHRPSSLGEAMEGRARLAFEELLFVPAAAAARQGAGARVRRGIRFENKRQLTTQLREALPFTLTGAQSRVLREIFADMCSDRRMQRLLQGDVGSGKTIVALFSALLAMENGFQAAIMAPTELLAEQHAGRWGGCSSRSASSRCSSPAAASEGAPRRRGAPRGSVAGAGRRHSRARPGGQPPFARLGLAVGRRAAPLRRRAAQGARRERGSARRAAHDRDADPTLARAHALR